MSQFCMLVGMLASSGEAFDIAKERCQGRDVRSLLFRSHNEISTVSKAASNFQMTTVRTIRHSGGHATYLETIEDLDLLRLSLGYR